MRKRCVPEQINFDEAPQEEISELTIDEEDADEFEAEGPESGAVSEFEGPVSLNDVFGTLDSYREADFEAVYGDGDKTKTDLEAERAEQERVERILEKRLRADDDSNEFYNESDAEFDPYVIPDEPTAEIGSLGQETKEAAPSKKKRWKIKRSMSITDEFKAVKSDGEDD